MWVISELYYPEDTSTGHFLTKIAEGLARIHDVKVLCAQPTYASRGRRAPRHQWRLGVEIRRCASTSLDKDVVGSRLINLLTISASIFWQAARRLRRGDIAIVVTNPPTLPFVVAIACRIRGARLLLLVHDVYPDVLVAAGLTDPGSLLSRGLGLAHRWLYRRAERVIVLGRDMRSLVLEDLAGAESRVVVIPNFADVNEVKPKLKKDTPLAADLGLRDKFVVQYSGNAGRTHGIEDLLGAAQLVESSDVVFLFIVAGAKSSMLAHAAQQEGRANIVVLDRRSRRDLPNSLNACDIAVISFVPGMAGVSVPSRMYNILAAGRPILAIADQESELAQVVREESVGWVLPPGQPKAVAAAIDKAHRDPDELEKMSARARHVAESKYSLQRINEAYDDLIMDLDRGAER